MHIWQKRGRFILLLIFSLSSRATSDLNCLAVALYHEANREPLRGQVAVLNVIENRMRLKHKSACAIIKERGQFSFVSKKTNWKPTRNMLTTYEKVSRMAPEVLQATHFYSGRKPAWTKKMKFVAKIGHHSFYELKGYGQ